MSNTAEGYIQKIFTREGSGNKGKWALDNVLMADDQGNEMGWYGLGFRDDAGVPPKCVEGDYLAFSWEQSGKYRNVVKGSAVIKKDKAPAASAPPAAAASASATGGSSTQQNIHYQNSRTAAIEVTGLLLANDALPITGAKGKAGQAKRFNEVKEYVNKLTVQFYNDLDSFRLFETVADAGVVDTSADGPLPDAEAEPEAPVAGDGDEPL